MPKDLLKIARPACAFCFTPKRVQLAEFDIGGVLYHANYFHLLEQAREALLEDHGCPYTEIVSEGSHLAVVESHQRFIKAISYGQELSIFVWISNLKHTSLTFSYEMTLKNDTEVRLHRAWTRQVFVTKSGGQFKTGRFPEKLLSVFQQFIHEPN